MSSERFDTIDMISSTVAHSIFHSTLDREFKMLVTTKMAPMFAVIPESEVQIPTVFTACDALADFKRDLRDRMVPVVVNNELFSQALMTLVRDYSMSEKEFTEVVTSKLFELLLAERTRKVFAIQRDRAEGRGDGRVGVAFGMSGEDKADGQ